MLSVRLVAIAEVAEGMITLASEGRARVEKTWIVNHGYSYLARYVDGQYAGQTCEHTAVPACTVWIEEQSSLTIGEVVVDVVADGAFLTITVDNEMNVVFHQDFDAEWDKVERAMRAVYDRMSQQFRDRGRCPFAPINLEDQS